MQSSNLKRVFAISGSLRSGSSNHNILNFLKRLAPPDIAFTIYDRLADIPPFDPGNDTDWVNEPVFELRSSIKHASAIIICTPEYAYGVPGQLKNALDWTVSSGSFSGKPTALITASTGGENAHEALLKTLGAIDASVTDDTKLLVSFIRSKMDSEGNIIDEATADSLKAVFNALLKTIQ
ncbi:NADPH-dependent FMN reductase [Mucilaginibacter sp. OK098]|uniref:NADPH-dependent FMN reductase n=1 Tax=Mucilaginibacter sp. OK098 TaxID=1855297 RepID=UPI00092229C7|nr:NADPH-dependent FMN reductase [Mucilaginibacter sp. OK098]SHM08521.1 NAD(P)H-dependent FMN reductase [Mucilaginibacter sp. OK098]